MRAAEAATAAAARTRTCANLISIAFAFSFYVHYFVTIAINGRAHTHVALHERTRRIRIDCVHTRASRPPVSNGQIYLYVSGCGGGCGGRGADTHAMQCVHRARRRRRCRPPIRVRVRVTTKRAYICRVQFSSPPATARPAYGCRRVCEGVRMCGCVCVFASARSTR